MPLHENQFPVGKYCTMAQLRIPMCRLLCSVTLLVQLEKFHLRDCDGTLSCLVVSLWNWLGLWAALELKFEVAQTSHTEFLFCWSWIMQRCTVTCVRGVSTPTSGSDGVIGSTCARPIGRDAMSCDRACSWATRSWYIFLCTIQLIIQV